MTVEGRIGHVKPEEAEEKKKKKKTLLCSVLVLDPVKVGQILQVRLMGSVYIFQEDKCSVIFPLVS